MTCGELKRQLGVSQLMSCGKFLKDAYTFFDNDIVHVVGKLRGGMEVNLDQLPDKVTLVLGFEVVPRPFLTKNPKSKLNPNPNPNPNYRHSLHP